MSAGDAVGHAARIPVPSLLSRSRSTWAAVVSATLLLCAVVVWALATRPLVDRVAALLLAALALGATLGLVVRRTWLEPARGLLVREVCGVWRRPVAWADATELRLRGNGAGQLLLEVRGRGRRTATYVPLVALNLGGDRSQRPTVLRALADQVEQWAPHRAAVARSLRAQADHLASGKVVRDSPLARTLLGRVDDREQPRTT